MRLSTSLRCYDVLANPVSMFSLSVFLQKRRVIFSQPTLFCFKKERGIADFYLVNAHELFNNCDYCLIVTWFAFQSVLILILAA